MLKCEIHQFVVCQTIKKREREKILIIRTYKNVIEKCVLYSTTKKKNREKAGDK